MILGATWVGILTKSYSYCWSFMIYQTSVLINIIYKYNIFPVLLYNILKYNKPPLSLGMFPYFLYFPMTFALMHPFFQDCVWTIQTRLAFVKRFHVGSVGHRIHIYIYILYMLIYIIYICTLYIHYIYSMHTYIHITSIYHLSQPK